MLNGEESPYLIAYEFTQYGVIRQIIDVSSDG